MSSELKLAEVQALYNMCRPHIRSFRTALDIGCDVFHFASQLENYFEHIHCWDFRDKSSQMTRVIDDPSKISHHVTALGEEPGVMYTKPGVGRIKSDQYGGSNTLKVEVNTLDSYSLFSDVDFIKMDVEGYEPNIIRGAVETIQSNWPVILCEINRGDFSAKILLEDMGYDCVGIHEKNGMPHDYLFIKK